VTGLIVSALSRSLHSKSMEMVKLNLVQSSRSSDPVADRVITSKAKSWTRR
jgi:hypothetical protein